MVFSPVFFYLIVSRSFKTFFFGSSCCLKISTSISFQRCFITPYLYKKNISLTCKISYFHYEEKINTENIERKEVIIWSPRILQTKPYPKVCIQHLFYSFPSYSKDLFFSLNNFILKPHAFNFALIRPCEGSQMPLTDFRVRNRNVFCYQKLVFLGIYVKR